MGESAKVNANDKYLLDEIMPLTYNSPMPAASGASGPATRNALVCSTMAAITLRPPAPAQLASGTQQAPAAAQYGGTSRRTQNTPIRASPPERPESGEAGYGAIPKNQGPLHRCDSAPSDKRYGAHVFRKASERAPYTRMREPVPPHIQTAHHQGHLYKVGRRPELCLHVNGKCNYSHCEYMHVLAHAANEDLMPVNYLWQYHLPKNISQEDVKFYQELHDKCSSTLDGWLDFLDEDMESIEDAYFNREFTYSFKNLHLS